jgi:hypothetical protein
MQPIAAICGLAVLTLAGPVVVGAPVAATTHEVHDQGSGFRVAPYLQNPSPDGMTITWITETAEPSRLTVRGPGLPAPAVYTTAPTYEPTLNYTEAERTQQIPGLEQGSWLRGEDNYKHTVDVSGLRADERYRYAVRHGSALFTEQFSTAPTDDGWRHIRFVAMSDSETEPLGRVQRREWAPGALADASEPRPSAEPGSPWDQKFGTTVLTTRTSTVRAMAHRRIATTTTASTTAP